MKQMPSRHSDLDAVSDQPISMLGHIFGAHVERIGLIRTLSGGLSMYLCIPLLIMAHTTIAVLFYQWLMRPIAGLERVHWSNHIFLDRNRIAGLTWFDKFNCDFCAYANGLTTMINLELDNMARWQGRLNIFHKALLLLVSWPIMLPFYLVGEILGMQMIYNILVSRPLGMHRTSFMQAWRMLQDEAYGQQLWGPQRLSLLLSKSIFLRFSLALEQIESSWCPLRHFETRQGAVFPKHHNRFFGAEQLREMYDVLRTEGTVSPRKPLY